MSKLSNSEEEETVTTEQVALGKYNAKGKLDPVINMTMSALDGELVPKCLI